MTPTDMEDAINKFERRFVAVEQILPTMATKADLDRFATKADLEQFATKADLDRFATKADLEQFATKADLEQCATKADLEQCATKADLERFGTKVDLEHSAIRRELRQGIDEAKRHTDIRIEDVRDDIRKVAEAVAGMSTVLVANQKTLEQVVTRLDVHEAILVDLTRNRL